MSRSKRMHDALSNELKPEHLIIENESHRHQVPADSETHFKVTVVSSHFNGLNRIARHSLVNACLHAEFSSGLHALTLHLYTPDEWQKKSNDVPASPLCHHTKHSN